jgi:outer membrane protein OmpA-like peptidoglycan-associated protein
MLTKRANIILSATVLTFVSFTSAADPIALPLDASRCSIAFALTGKETPGCALPDQPIGITRSLKTAQVGGYRVHFGFDSGVLNKEAQAHLSQLSALLTGPLSNLCVKFVGHTDTKGSVQYNQSLSLKRAQSVRLFMAGPGKVSAERLIAQGEGETRPLSNVAGSHSSNRRVEIFAKKSPSGQCP